MEMLPTYTSLERPKPGREYTILIAIIGALWLVLSIVGCSKQTQTGNVAETTAVGDTTHTNGYGTAYADTTHLTNGNILAELRESDSAEVALGKLGESKAKSPAVKNFARMLVTDHSRLLKDDDQLATQTNITPTPPANDSNSSHLTATISSLNSASNGNSFDTVFMDNAVTDHTNDLADLKSFDTVATSPQLKDAIRKAEPVVQKHLTRAQEIQRDLTKQPMAMQNRHR